MLEYGTWPPANIVVWRYVVIDVALKELSIEVTNRCLMRCIHCSSGSQPKAEDNELTPDIHKRLIVEARALGATVLSLSGGDPILWPWSVEYVELAKSVGYENILFYTTGIWSADLPAIDAPGNTVPILCLGGILDWDDIFGLSQAGGDALRFIFSVHSHRPEVHDFIMGVSAAWHTIVSNIVQMKNHGIVNDIEIHMVPMLPNYAHISKMRDMCHEIGVSRMSLLRFVPQTRGQANRRLLEMTADEFRSMQEILDYEMTSRVHHPVELRLGCPIDFRHTIGATSKKSKPCHAGKDLILVRPDGNVHPCAAWKTLPDDANVRDRPLSDIWENAAVFNALRDLHRNGCLDKHRPHEDQHYCGGCAFVDSCNGGCPAQKLHAYGKTLDAMYDYRSDPLCPIGSEA